MKIEISKYHFVNLVKEGISLDHIYCMQLLEDGHDPSGFLSNFGRGKILLQALIRKNLITEDSTEVTAEGKRILEFLGTEEKEVIPMSKSVLKKPRNEDFDKWWSAYPATDTVMDKTGKILHQGSRGLRNNKSECQEKINKILAEGKYTIEDLIGALKYEVDLKINQSIRQKKNTLSYMKNSLTYLNSRTFENFIELAKTSKVKQEKEPNSNNNITGI